MHDTKYHERVSVSIYQSTRSVFQRVFMRKGRYVILPTTTKANLTGRFLLRMYISGSANVRYAFLEKMARSRNILLPSATVIAERLCFHRCLSVHPPRHTLPRQTSPWADTHLWADTPRQIPHELATAADGTHSTGMHSCKLNINSLTIKDLTFLLLPSSVYLDP